MTQQLYRVTLEPLQPAADATHSSLAFEIANHDDIAAVVERIRGRANFDRDTACALGVGLKLFSEVMLQNRTHPLFASFLPHFQQFMKDMKRAPAANSSPA